MRPWSLAAASVAVVLAGPLPAAHATLAYVTGALQGKPVVWVAGDDGRNARPLIRGAFEPRVSPDGTQVAFIVGFRNARLKVKPVDGGPTRRLISHVWSYDAVRWSPDGQSLAVVVGPELGPYRLKLVNVTTRSKRTLAKGYFNGVSFAPGGEGITWSRSFTDAYPIKANLYTSATASGPVRRLTSDGNATSPVWGPERIAYDRARRPPKRGDYDKLDIYTVLPDGSDRRRLTTTNPPFLLAGLTPLGWSADGKRLLAEYGGQDTSEAWRVSAKNGKAVDASGGFDGVVGWELSHDGTAILATTGYFDDPNGDVVSIAWAGRAQTVLARHATQPSWSR